MAMQFRKPSPLPGFGLTFGYTVVYLGLMVLLPLCALVWSSAQMTWADFWHTVTRQSVINAFRLTFGTSLVAALVNALFGFILAWSLVRYQFLGKRFIDAAVDLPFALPTAVSGIALTAIYAKSGWIGRYLEPWDIQVAYTPLGVMVALTFIGLPFVVRTLQPAIADLDLATEEAAASLGASRGQTFRRVILPAVLPALLTGFAMAFARAIGEYGSVVFISGNRPLETEIVPLLIVQKLDQHHPLEATAIATVMLAASFTMILAVNLIQWWSSHRHRGVV